MDRIKYKGSDFSLKDFIKPFLKRWYWFVIGVIVALLMAIAFIKFTAPVYVVSSSALIKDTKKSPTSEFTILKDIGGLGGMNSSSIENEIEIFKSKKLIREVVRELNLQTRLFAEGTFYDTELYKDTAPVLFKVIKEKEFVEMPKKRIYLNIASNGVEFISEEFNEVIKGSYNSVVNLPFAQIMVIKNDNYKPIRTKKVDGLDKLFFSYSTEESAVTAVQKSIFQKLLDKDGTVIGFSTKSSNTDKAKDILGSLVRQYNIDAAEEKGEESKKTKDFIDERISIIANELGNVESQKERFKVDNNIVDLPTEARMGLQISTEAKRKLMELETQREVISGLMTYIDRQSNTSVLPTNIGLDNPAASSNISAYNLLVIERNRLLQSATEDHPLVKEITRDISNLRKAIKESLGKAKNTTDITISQISAENATYSNKISKIPTQEKMFRNIERQQQIKENLYLLLLEKREEAAITLAMTTEKAKVVDYPYVDPKPYAPKVPIILVTSLLFGLLIPGGYIYLKQLLNDKIVDKNDIEKISSISIIGELPKANVKDGEFLEMNSTSPIAEAFRILSTNMNYMLPDQKEGKIIYVTSSVKGEGKTFVSANLASSLATAAKKVVVIGADIRNPQLQRYDVSKKNSMGLTEYLYTDVDIDQIINTSKHNKFCDVIYSGAIPPNPTELLSNGKFEQLLQELQKRYDYIIVDTAPLLLVTDTFLISQHSQMMVYVTRSEYTEKSLIEFANKAKEDRKIDNVGFVLNDVAKENFGYGNKYGYGYQATEKKWYQKIFNS